MHVTDDRGQRVKLIPVRHLRAFRVMRSPIPLEARRQIYGKTMCLHWPGVRIPVGIWLTLTALWWLSLWQSTFLFRTPATPRFATFLVLINLPWLALPVARYFSIRWIRQAIAFTVCKHGYCASCGYSMVQLEPDGDGCTVCPECGSAWRIPAAKDV